MNVSVLIVPGPGQKTVAFAAHEQPNINDVIRATRKQHSVDISNREFSVNGEDVTKDNWGATRVWPGDLVSATGVVKGAKPHPDTKYTDLV